VAAAYRFGPFLVDRSGYRVMRGGVQLDLTPKLLDLLLLLLDHAGELVTKEELLDALWRDANVTDNALAQAVSELRDTLGDEPAAPTYIKTVARRGYRFVAPVTPLPEPASAPTGGAAPIDDDSLAVLDFTNLSGDADAAWLSAGIAETVSADLAASGRFKVIDRWRVVEAARRPDAAFQDIALALRVRLVVVGSFQRHGERVRVTARIVDVPSGDAIADAKVDGGLSDIFALQDQVAAQFARELGVAGDAAPRHRDTPSLDAYRALVEGWLKVDTLDVQALPAAIADFERAIAIDPKYALAHTGLASAELALYESTRTDNHPERPRLARAAAEARRAIELDEHLAEAHGALAMILVSSWESPEAIRAARRAVALEPGNWRHLFRLGHATWGDERLRAGAATLAVYPDFAFSYFQTAMVHVARGHLAEAERVLQHGTAVQDRQIARGDRYPALGLHWLLGLVRLAQEDVTEALEEFDRELALAEPQRLYGREYAMYARLGRGSALVRDGRGAAAAEAFREALAIFPAHPLALVGAAMTTGSSFARAETAIADMRASKPIEAALATGALLAVQGDQAQAAAVLGQVLEEAPPGFAGWELPVQPLLRHLAETPPIRAILARLAERALG
jgi:DNA-binding winged helix-turn-helix (wHTH) protein/Tfp pilus assembly protein PilF